MAKMKKCKVCKNLIAKNTTNCPHCGAVYKKRGCLPKIIACIIGAIVVVAIIHKSPEEERNDKIKEQKYAEAERQKKDLEIVDNNEILIISQNFLENKIPNAKLKYTSPIKIEKVDIVKDFQIPPNVDSNNLYSASQTFEEQNAFGVWLKHKYLVIVEFRPKKGYRFLGLMIDDVLISI